MNRIHFSFILAIALVTNTFASTNGELAEAMLFIVAPTNEDPEAYEAAISVCSCALSKAQDLWDQNSYEKLTTDVLEYARNVEAAIKSAEALKFGTPIKSKSLLEGLNRLSPLIVECEEKYGTRVEF